MVANFLLSVFCLLAVGARGISAALNARSEECFELEVRQSETLSGSFDVITGGASHFRLHATGRETKRRRINFDNVPKATFTLTPDHTEGDVGVYDLCLENLENFPIHVAFGYHSNLDPSSDVATDKDTSELNLMAQGLLSRLTEMERQQSFAIRREAAQLEGAAKASARAAFWILAKVVAGIAVVLAQVLYLRSFFEVKQVV